jgi:hypothetical protein
VGTFLSSEWFERARELVVETGSMPGIGYRIQFDADGERWFQVAVDGTITEWAAGDVAQPDQEIHTTLDVARAIHRREIDGTEAFSRCWVVMPDGSTSVPTPVDVAERPELDDLPHQPDATFVVQYHHSDGPFGEVAWWWQFIDGRSEDAGFGVADEPDVTVFLPFARTVSVRNGDLSIYEAIERGRVDGEVGPLMLLAGMLEAPEVRAAQLACGPRGIAPANLGLVTAQPDVRAGLATLATETD